MFPALEAGHCTAGYEIFVEDFPVLVGCEIRRSDCNRSTQNGRPPLVRHFTHFLVMGGVFIEAR